MHALFITFRTEIPPADLKNGFTQFAEAMRDDAEGGLVAKTWIVDGSTVGGFSVFENREFAERYLNGMFADAVDGNPAFSEVRIEHYDVIEALSRITKGISVAAVGARS